MAGPNYGLDKGYQAAGAIRKFRCVEISATETVTEVNGANDAVLGVCQDSIVADDATNGRIADIRITGISRCIAGGTLDPTVNGGLVTSDAEGRVIAVGVVAGTVYNVVGKCLQAAVVGDHVDVLLTPGVTRNAAAS